jgi:hypothetical protein
MFVLRLSMFKTPVIGISPTSTTLTPTLSRLREREFYPISVCVDADTFESLANMKTISIR